MIAIKAENIGKRFGDVTALEDINLQVAEGELFGLIGPDGTVLQVADPRTQTALEQSLPLEASVTPGIRFGSWIGHAAVAITLLALALSMITYRRSSRSQRPLPVDGEPDRVLTGSSH